jgi:hypothetical protein
MGEAVGPSYQHRSHEDVPRAHQLFGIRYALEQPHEDGVFDLLLQPLLPVEELCRNEGLYENMEHQKPLGLHQLKLSLTDLMEPLVG